MIMNERNAEWKGTSHRCKEFGHSGVMCDKEEKNSEVRDLEQP